MGFPVLWSGLVSQVGASHRVNLIAPFLLGQNCPGKIAMSMSISMSFALVCKQVYECKGSV